MRTKSDNGNCERKVVDSNLLFPHSFSINFNLRDPKSRQPQMIYACINYKGLNARYKISTGLKVYPFEWDKKKQEAIELKDLGRISYKNSLVINMKLRTIIINFEDYKRYIQDYPHAITSEDLLRKKLGLVEKGGFKPQTKPVMEEVKKKTKTQAQLDTLIKARANHKATEKAIVRKKKTIDKKHTTILPTRKINSDKASDLFNAAIECRYPDDSPNISASTKKQAIIMINGFIKYLKEHRIDNAKYITQETLNNYKIYLKETKSSDARTNRRCGIVKLLINDVLQKNSDFTEFKKFGIKKVDYNKIKDYRNQSEIKHFALEENEIELIRNVDIDSKAPEKIYAKEYNKSLTITREALKEYKDIFLLQIACGQRVSDLRQLLTKEYTEKKDYYIIKTMKGKKHGIEAYVPKNDPTIKAFFKKYSDGLKHVNANIIGDSLDNNKYNIAIKYICQLANLNRIIEYKDTKGKRHEGYVYDEITSHTARHTFVTSMLRKGVSPDKLQYLTGHTDDTMIKKIYSHLTQDDKMNMLNEVYPTQSPTTPPPTSHSVQQETIKPKWNSLAALNRLREIEANKNKHKNNE